MLSGLTVYPTLIQRALGPDRAIFRNVALAIGGTLCLWVSAKIQIPFYPVPMTMLTFMVLAIGMAFGWRLGAAAIAVYLVEGAFGLPVFAGTPEKGVGLAYMLGPTGGYLLGCLPAAALCGWLAERGWDRDFAMTALAMFAGNLVIYGFGLAWLGSVVGWDKPVLAWGLTPFLLGDLTKLALVTALLPVAWRLLGRSRFENN
jgi:biotin transport system substrate-specific component